MTKQHGPEWQSALTVVQHAPPPQIADEEPSCAP